MATIEILGSGTSNGVPAIGCQCYVCTSEDPRDKRSRQSAVIHLDDGFNILIDCGPDFRSQALRSKLRRVDCLLLTHPHCDHVCGLDDLKPFAKDKPIPLYTNEQTLQNAENMVIGKDPMFDRHIITGEFQIDKYKIIPIPLMHGRLPLYGFRIGNLAYLTDTNRIPESSYELLKGVDILLIDGLENNWHPTHFSYTEAIQEILKIKPKTAYLIHIADSMTHEDIYLLIEREKRKYPDLSQILIEPAYDGLVINGVDASA